MAKSECGEPDPPDSSPVDGLNYAWDYIFPRWLDNRKYGIYPDGKGRDDQQQDLLDDFANLDRRYNWHLFRATRK